MTKQEIINAIQATLEELRNTDFVPNPKTRYQKGGSTGNLKDNGLSINITQKEVVIFLDQSKAPYVPYTNDPWVSPKWNGKHNPNEGWWERFVEEFTRRLAQKLGGKITT